MDTKTKKKIEDIKKDILKLEEKISLLDLKLSDKECELKVIIDSEKERELQAN